MDEGYNVGDVLALEGRFYAASAYDPIAGTGSPVVPSTVTIAARNPLGTVLSITPTQVATGIYQGEQPLTLGGVWTWRITGTGAHQGAEEGRVRVASTVFP